MGDLMVLHVGGYKIALDRHEVESDTNFVSHAHSDHISGIRKAKGTITSEITRDLLKTRGKNVTMMDAPRGTKLLNAGHMLGSKQFYVESDINGYSIVYTGDYQMQKSYATEAIEVRKADILVIDSTYPHPNIVFDERSEVVSAIQCYSKQKINWGTLLFGAYSMGKTQELIRIFNEIGIAPVVDAKVAEINKVYESHGVKLDYEAAEGGLPANGNFVGIVNVSKLKERKYELEKRSGRKVFTAVATGFAKICTFDTDVQFALSDHADFKQAIEYISLCEPKMIYTVGSQSGMFAMNLTRAGYKANPLFASALLNLPVTAHGTAYSGSPLLNL